MTHWVLIGIITHSDGKLGWHLGIKGHGHFMFLSTYIGHGKDHFYIVSEITLSYKTDNVLGKCP